MEESSNGGGGGGEESYVEDGGNGKKRKYCGGGSSSQEVLKDETMSFLFSSLFKSYSSSSKNGKRTLKILNQPEQQHRARYQTEGSRGSVKDREGSGFPTIQLKGYHGPEKKLRLQVFIGSDQGRPVLPHVYYQACKVAGKNSTPSQEWRQEGTDIILMDMEADKDFIVRCDCVGILKERYSDIENKIPAQKQRTNWKKKSTKCRMVFRIEFEEEDGSKETLQVVSDPISCSQQPGTPEILKMSTDTSSLPGGGELWMIGKNFLKDAVVVFQENLSTSEALHRAPWRQIIHPDKDFFNNSHMIVTIPPYTLGPGVEHQPSCPIDVSVFIKCGEKTSDSHSFTYRLKETKDHNSSTSSSPKSFSPIRSNRSNPSSRITILEPVETRYMTKEEIDYCEDTVFDPEKTQEDVKGSYIYRQSIQEESDSISFSNTTTTNHNNNNNNNPDEEFKSDRVTTFSNLFQKDKSSSNVSHSIGDSSPGVMVIPKISSDTLKAAQKELLKNVGDVSLESKIMVNGNNNGTLANSSQEFLGTNIESKSATNGPIYIQGTESDNATISIKLPNSIISNSEKFENVMNTINKALLQPDPTLKSIDSNLARVDISRNNNASSNNASTPSAPTTEQPPSQATQITPSPSTPAVPSPLVVTEPTELNPKKQKINEQVITSQPRSNWLETWNTSTTTTSPITKEAPKGPTPMDTTPFFTTQAPPEPPSTWSEQPPPQEKSQINLSNIIPELKSNTAAAVSENWNSVKVEAENWSKSAPITWSSNVAATESWHTPATTVAVTQNWRAPSSENNKNWNENQVPTSETWPNAATVVATENIVISANTVSPPAAEVVWQTKPAEGTPNPVNETPPAPTNSWPEKAKEQVIVASANWSTESKKESNGSEAPNWFNESAKIDTIWNEEWGNSGSSGNTGGGGGKANEATQHAPAPQWNVSEKPVTGDHSGTSTWTADTATTNDQNTPTQQNWVSEGGKLGAWNNQVGEGSGATNAITEKKAIGDIVVAPYISQEMTPIDPKKVMYDPSPMEVDGVFTKSKMDYKASEINPNSGSIKGNPLLSESSAIISQQQKIESAIIEPGKVSEYQPIKYQPATEGLYQLFSNTQAPDVQK